MLRLSVNFRAAPNWKPYWYDRPRMNVSNLYPGLNGCMSLPAKSLDENVDATIDKAEMADSNEGRPLSY